MQFKQQQQYQKRFQYIWFERKIKKKKIKNFEYSLVKYKRGAKNQTHVIFHNLKHSFFSKTNLSNYISE